MGIRMAMAPALRAFKEIFPFHGKGAPMHYAMRFGPELLGAGMMAAAAPPETGLGTRALIGGEDVLASLGLSVLGSGIGRTLGRRRMAKKMGMTSKGLPKRGGIEILDEAGQNIDLSGMSPALAAKQRQNAIKMAGMEGASLGDMVMMPAQFLRPSPSLNAAQDDYIRKQQDLQAAAEAQQGVNEQMNLEGLMEALIAIGGTAGGAHMLRNLSPLDVSKPAVTSPFPGNALAVIT